MTSVEIAAATHTGLVRRRNEDFHGIGGLEATRTDGEVVGCSSTTLPLLAVVADGLGGHPAGDEASRMAVEHILAEQPVDEQGLVEAILGANELLVASMNDAKQNEGMGSTIAAVLIRESGLIVANVGDSAVLELADGRLHQLTVDDVPAAGPSLPVLSSSLVTQTLGGHFRLVEVQVHVHEDDLPLPRRLLLCTDGLTSCVPRTRIAAVLAAGTPPTEAVDNLIALALEAGGRDNVSVVVIDVV